MLLKCSNWRRTSLDVCIRERRHVTSWLSPVSGTLSRECEWAVYCTSFMVGSQSKRWRKFVGTVERRIQNNKCKGTLVLVPQPQMNARIEGCLDTPSVIGDAGYSHDTNLFKHMDIGFFSDFSALEKLSLLRWVSFSFAANIDPVVCIKEEAAIPLSC
jgi:hypothetical protein